MSSSTTSSSARPTPSASVSSSFIFTDVAAGSDRSDRDDDVDSLPSISSSILGSDDDDLARSDAQREWEASLEQLQLLLTMILMPFAGKFLGRKFAYYSWARYMEWFHHVDIQWTGKTASNAVGAAASL